MVRSIKRASVAVVGGAGFLGSHLVNHLIEDRDCKVLVVDNLVAGRREFVNRYATFVHHDITGSESRLRSLFESHSVKFVFNYAAYPYIPVSFARPIHVCDVNFMGAMQVINAAKEAGCEAILQVSSAEIYGTGAGSIDEEFSVQPHSSYGVAKAAVDNWVQCRWKEAKTPCIALRQFNCVGERETHPYIVPEIIGQLMAQTKDFTWCPDDSCVSKKTTDANRDTVATIRLGNNSFRDFLYAGDAVKMAVELLERGEFGEVYNLGSETGIKMYDLAILIASIMGFKNVEVIQDPARVRPWEIWHLLSNNNKIHDAIATRPTISLHEALARTIAWYDANNAKWGWES